LRPELLLAVPQVPPQVSQLAAVVAVPLAATEPLAVV